MPFIHVIIPCYNVEKYLEQAVYSVLNQPCKEIDIVLVDDGSPGRTPQLCDELAAKEPRVHVVHKKNGGVSNARNSGIEFVLDHLLHGEREFIAFLDGDDIWMPGVINDVLAEHLRTDWNEDVISFAGVLGNNQLNRFSQKLSVPDRAAADARQMMWDGQLVTFSSKLYSVDVFRKWNIRFQSGLKYSEDRIFALQFYFLADKARFVNKTLHVYRKNQTGAMMAQHKLSAADYYLPIIDGWLKCDDFLNALSCRTNAAATMGQSLAAIYLVDMVAEQMKKWGSFRKIMDALRSHPHYPAAESGALVRHNQREYSKNRLLFEHPLKFRMKYRLIGAAEWILGKLLSVPAIAALWDKRRYPFTEIPD